MTPFFTPFTVWMEVIQLNMLAALPDLSNPPLVVYERNDEKSKEDEDSSKEA